MESAEEKWGREYSQDGMGGEECQEWSATGEYQLEWKGRCQVGSATSKVVRVGASGTDEKTGDGDGGGRVEDVAIFIRSDKNGQDQEWVHQRDSTGGKVCREYTRGKTEMVWSPMEER